MATIKCTIDKSDWYEMYIEYSATANATDDKATISHSLKLKKLTSGYDFNGKMDVSYYIGGKEFSYSGNVNIVGKASGYITTIKSGTTQISRNTTTGGFKFTVSCSGSCNSGGYGPGNIKISEQTVGLSKKYRKAIYTLTTSAGTGSSITVSRTSSGGSGSTGALSNGVSLYYEDKLKITFSAKNGYKLNKHTVNGSAFTSGNTHTVGKNVTVNATATALASTISATNANIGSNSTITITKANTSYTHTITYSFEGLSGTICSKSSDSSISWTVPTTFYAKIPNAKTGKCALTCDTYSGSTKLGSNTCTITVTAKGNPSVTGTVVDTNATTIALTGDSSKLIKYMSTAKCTLTATAKNSSTISSAKIDGATVTNGGAKSYTNVDKTSFLFSATDSRGYSSSVAVNPTVIPYVKLTCNPVITRPEPTGSEIVMTISGKVFGGSFGACSNTLSVKYRYKKSSESTYGSWTTLESSSYSITGSTSTYKTTSAISVGTDFDYNTSYDFQVMACDGGAVDDTDYTLSKVTANRTVKRGIPVFDWGENDFNFNVPVTCKDGLTVGGWEYGQGKMLWSGAYGMNSTQKATLSEPISKQPNGIELVFSRYNQTDAVAEDWGFQSFFVSKKQVELLPGLGHCFTFAHQTFSAIGGKYLYINDSDIAGHAGNVAHDTTSGIPYDNRNWVLRYVIGV